MTNTKRGGVFISPKPIKTSVMIDMYGNIIDPQTKTIIKPNNDK